MIEGSGSGSGGPKTCGSGSGTLLETIFRISCFPLEEYIVQNYTNLSLVQLFFISQHPNFVPFFLVFMLKKYSSIKDDIKIRYDIPQVKIGNTK
jgi:hypothetical protein